MRGSNLLGCAAVEADTLTTRPPRDSPRELGECNRCESKERSGWGARGGEERGADRGREWRYPEAMLTPSPLPLPRLGSSPVPSPSPPPPPTPFAPTPTLAPPHPWVQRDYCLPLLSEMLSNTVVDGVLWPAVCVKRQVCASGPWSLSVQWVFSSDVDRLVGLVVKASASRAEDPGFESRLRRDFFWVESYQGLVGPVSVYCDWVR